MAAAPAGLTSGDRENAAIKMFCEQLLGASHRPGLHLGGVRVMSMPGLFDSYRVGRKKKEKKTVCGRWEQLPTWGDV